MQAPTVPNVADTQATSAASRARPSAAATVSDALMARPDFSLRAQRDPASFAAGYERAGAMVPGPMDANPRTFSTIGGVRGIAQDVGRTAAGMGSDVAGASEAVAGGVGQAARYVWTGDATLPPPAMQRPAAPAAQAPVVQAPVAQPAPAAPVAQAPVAPAPRTGVFVGGQRWTPDMPTSAPVTQAMREAEARLVQMTPEQRTAWFASDEGQRLMENEVNTERMMREAVASGDARFVMPSATITTPPPAGKQGRANQVTRTLADARAEVPPPANFAEGMARMPTSTVAQVKAGQTAYQKRLEADRATAKANMDRLTAFSDADNAAAAKRGMTREAASGISEQRRERSLYGRQGYAALAQERARQIGAGEQRKFEADENEKERKTRKDIAAGQDKARVEAAQAAGGMRGGALTLQQQKAQLAALDKDIKAKQAELAEAEVGKEDWPEGVSPESRRRGDLQTQLTELLRRRAEIVNSMNAGTEDVAEPTEGTEIENDAGEVMVLHNGQWVPLT